MKLFLFTVLFTAEVFGQTLVLDGFGGGGSGGGTSGGGGGITIISTNSTATAAESTSMTLSIPNTVLANDTLIVGVCDVNTITTPTGFTEANSFPDDNNAKIFYKNAAGGETSVSISTSIGHGVAFLLHARGLSTSPKDQVSTNWNQSNPLSCGTTPTTTAANELVVAMATHPQTSPTLSSEPAGFTTFNQFSTGAGGSFGHVRGYFSYKIVAATGAQTCSYALTGATPSGNSGSGGVTTFK